MWGSKLHFNALWNLCPAVWGLRSPLVCDTGLDPNSRLPGRAASPRRRSIYSGYALWVKTTSIWQQSAGLMRRLQGQYRGSDSFSHSCPSRGTCLNTKAGETICKTTDRVLRVQWRTHTADSCDSPCFPAPPRQVVKKRTGSCVLCSWRHPCCVLYQPQLVHSPLGTRAAEFSADQPHQAGLQWGISFSLCSLAPFLDGSVGKAFPLLPAKPIGFPRCFL